MSSAKLQVRPILLKKISFMIFFNNYLSDSQYVAIEKKNQQWFDRLTILSGVEGSRRNDFFFCRVGLATPNCSAEVVG